MTVNKFIPPIHIHPILIIFIFISLATGTFTHLFIILLIVLLHELGHYLMAQFFNWRINRIMLWIFGGVMETDEHGSKPFREEFLVTIAGPVQHLFIYLLLYMNSFGVMHIISSPIVDLIFYYNTMILIFNLLPIWPLDGGKLLFLILSTFFPFRKAYNMNLLISMIGSFLLLVIHIFLFSFNLSALLIFVFLFMENKIEWQKRYYVFIRFLLNNNKEKRKIKMCKKIQLYNITLLLECFPKFIKIKNLKF